MPTPNRGLQAAGLAYVTQAVRILSMALPILGAETDQGGAVMSAIKSLTKHIPPGSGSAGVENSALRNLMMQQKANAPMQQVLRNQGGGGAPGGAPPMPAPAPTPAAA